MCNRPFKDVNEMNRVMLTNWKETVSDEDTVYHLGDVFWSRQLARVIMPQLTGRITFLLGNHDKALLAIMSAYPQHTYVGSLYGNHIEEEGQLRILSPVVAFLSHRPQDEAIWSRYGRYHFHGHTHDKLPSEGHRFNVSVEQIGYRPVEITSLIKVIDTPKEYCKTCQSEQVTIPKLGGNICSNCRRILSYH